MADPFAVKVARISGQGPPWNEVCKEVGQLEGYLRDAFPGGRDWRAVDFGTSADPWAVVRFSDKEDAKEVCGQREIVGLGPCRISPA